MLVVTAISIGKRELDLKVSHNTLRSTLLFTVDFAEFPF